MHEPLECHQGVTEPVRHSQKLIHSHAPHHKGGVLLGVFGHFDLPKPGFQVHGLEELGTYHGFHSLLHPRKGISILLGPAVQPSKVNTELDTPILLPYQYHSITPW